MRAETQDGGKSNANGPIGRWVVCKVLIKKRVFEHKLNKNKFGSLLVFLYLCNHLKKNKV